LGGSVDNAPQWRKRHRPAVRWSLVLRRPVQLTPLRTAYWQPGATNQASMRLLN